MAENTTRWWTHTRIPRHDKPLMLVDNRHVRLAIAARTLAIPQEYFGVQCDEKIADDAIARPGPRVANRLKQMSTRYSCRGTKKANGSTSLSNHSMQRKIH